MFFGKSWRHLVNRNSKASTRNRKPSSIRYAPRLEQLEDRRVLSSPGTLDPTFGTGGIVSVSLSPSLPADFLNALVIQPDGKLVAAGGVNAGGQAGEFAVARFNSQGSLDTSFGTGGSTFT